jgi:hypothetical protein
VLRRIFGLKRDKVTVKSRRPIQQGALCSVLFTKHNSGDKVADTTIGSVCSKYGGEERCIQGLSEETWGKEPTWKTKVLDGRIILKWILKKWGREAWTGSVSLRIETSGGLL